jgi:hypothetical protein
MEKCHVIDFEVGPLALDYSDEERRSARKAATSKWRHGRLLHRLAHEVRASEAFDDPTDQRR